MLAMYCNQLKCTGYIFSINMYLHSILMLLFVWFNICHYCCHLFPIVQV